MNATLVIFAVTIASTSKVDLIKLVRSLLTTTTGLKPGLKEAKDYVDGWNSVLIDDVNDLREYRSPHIYLNTDQLKLLISLLGDGFNPVLGVTEEYKSVRLTYAQQTTNTNIGPYKAVTSDFFRW